MRSETKTGFSESDLEILPREIHSFELPPGLELPPNILMTEMEAARFLREPEDRLRKRRFTGTGPTFIKIADEPWAVRYLVWDCLSWLCQHRRTVMPESPRGRSRKAAHAAEAAQAA